MNDQLFFELKFVDFARRVVGMWRTYFAVMAGGTIGVIARMWITDSFNARYGDHFPMGTVVVNVLGCFIIGIFTSLVGSQGPWTIPLWVRQAVVIGILGGFTTFSSFSLQTIQLLQQERWLYAGLNILISVFACLLATWMGMSFVSFLLKR